jgi:Ca-activated chloride channel family protein
MKCLLMGTLLMAGTLAINASSEAGAQGVFKSGVDMVPLTVTVTDASGKYIRGLTERDFAVFENGVQQSLSFFAGEPLPVDVALVLDVSSSMAADMPRVREAAGGLVRSLRPSDRAAVVAVRTSVEMAQPFTAERERVTAAIDGLRSSGSTAVYDGLYIALKEFARERREHAEVRRQVLVLLSDGLDNASHLSADETADAARRAGVSIYVVALTGPAPPTRGTPWNVAQERATYTMRALAQDSGGRIFLPAAPTELAAVYGAIARELASQYDLGYVPAKPGDGTFRRIAVRVLAPASGIARTRNGYLAARTRPEAPSISE